MAADHEGTDNIDKLGKKIADDNIERIRKLGEKLVDPDFVIQVFEEALPDPLVIVNESGHIKFVNRLLEIMFGYHRTELYDQPIEMLVPESARDRHMSHRKDYTDDPKTRPMGMGMVLQGRHRSGATFDVEISLAPVMARQGYFTVATIRKRRPHADR